MRLSSWRGAHTIGSGNLAAPMFCARAGATQCASNGLAARKRVKRRRVMARSNPVDNASLLAPELTAKPPDHCRGTLHCVARELHRPSPKLRAPLDSRRLLDPAHLPRNPNRTFQRLAVPASSLRCGRIRRGQKVQQQGVRFRGRAHGVIGQDELAQRLVEVGTRRYRSIAEARRLRISIGIESSLRKRLIARPKPGAAELVRIGFARDRVGQPRYAARMTRGGPPGETGHSEIEAAPKEMNGAPFA